MNLSKAQKQYKWLVRFSIAAPILFVAMFFAKEFAGDDFALVVGMAAAIVWIAAIGVLGFLANSLGKVGILYMFLSLVFNVLGFIGCFIYLRGLLNSEVSKNPFNSSLHIDPQAGQ